MARKNKKELEKSSQGQAIRFSQVQNYRNTIQAEIV